MLKKIDKNLVILAAGLVTGLSLGLLVLAGMKVGISEQIPGSNLSLVEDSNPRVGFQAPDFILSGMDGKSVQLSTFEGLPVLVNFWATWCEPCQAEMPLLESTFQAHPYDLVLLAVNDDEPEDVVRGYILDMRLTLKVLLDPGEKTLHAYHVTGLPTSFFIDSEGVIRFIKVGILNEDDLEVHLGWIGVGK